MPATRHLRSVADGQVTNRTDRPRVLLVDDVPGEAANFRVAFGDELTAVRSLPDLDGRLADGVEWDVAFVDFNLSSPSATGLSALLALRRRRPATRLVSYSQFAENGRVLYAAGARQWLGTRAVLDKTHNDPYTLRFYAGALLHLRAPQLRSFKDRATEAVVRFNTAFFDRAELGSSRNKKGILGTFVAQHTSFLTAADLPAILAHRDLSVAAD